MKGTRFAIQTMAVTLLIMLGATDVSATMITLTAVVSDRGIDHALRDGIFDNVFGDSSVTQITTPPLGNLDSEERTAIEFMLGAIPSGSIIDSLALQLSPQGGSMNLGLSAAEMGEIHGYAGNGVIQVGDMMVMNLVGSIPGPTPDGAVTISILTGWFQSLIDSASPFAGMMFKGVDGPNAVTFSFAGTFSGIPVAQRPTLFVEFHEGGTVIPEPSTLVLFGTGAVAMLLRARRRQSGS